MHVVEETPLYMFLRDLMHRFRLLPSQLAVEVGVSHATVSRWLSGKDIPSVKSCRKLAEFSGVSLQKVLSTAGYLPEAPVAGYVNLPDFTEYARLKYADELDEDLIIMIEDLIRRRRTKNKQ